MRITAHRLRLLSAAVALAVGLISANIAWILTASDMAYVGIPIAGVLGWCLGPGLQPEGHSHVRSTAKMAAGCTVLGAYGTAVALSCDPLMSVALSVVGIAVFGIPCFLILNVPSLAWALVTSWLIDLGVGIGGPISVTARPRGAIAGLVPTLAIVLLVLLAPTSATSRVARYATTVTRPQEVAFSLALVAGLAMSAGWLAGPLAAGQPRRLLVAAIGYAIALIAAIVTLSIIQGAWDTWAERGLDPLALAGAIAGRALYGLAGTIYLFIPAFASGLAWSIAARGLGRFEGARP